MSLDIVSRRFSHPVAVLPRAALSINNSDAVILSINSTGPRGDLCSDFSIRITVTLHLGSSATACVQLHVRLPSRKGAVPCIRIDRTVLHVSWHLLLPCQNLQVLFSPWQTRETVVCLDIRGDAVTDVDGNTFPNATVCKVADHRCRRSQHVMNIVKSGNT